MARKGSIKNLGKVQSEMRGAWKARKEAKTAAREDAEKKAAATLMEVDRQGAGLVHYNGLVSLVYPWTDQSGGLAWWYTNPRQLAELSSPLLHARAAPMGAGGAYATMADAMDSALCHMVQNQDPIPDTYPSGLSQRSIDLLNSLRDARKK